MIGIITGSNTGFNPRTYIRYDPTQKQAYDHHRGFNPRTYIRYDLRSGYTVRAGIRVSIHVPI